MVQAPGILSGRICIQPLVPESSRHTRRLNIKDNTQSPTAFNVTYLGKYDGIGYEPVAPPVATSVYLHDFFYTNGAGVNGLRNNGPINDPQLNELIDKQAQEFNADTRKQYFHQIEDTVAEAQYYICCSTFPLGFFWDPSLQNARLSAYKTGSYAYTKRWWFDKTPT